MSDQPERVPPAYVPIPDGEQYPVQPPRAPLRFRATIVACAVVALVVMAAGIAGCLP